MGSTSNGIDCKEILRFSGARSNNLFAIFNDENVGRYLAAIEDIEAGTVIIEEYPLITGPAQVTGPVCLSCLNSINANNSAQCNRCGWPLCRKPDCRETENHKAECDWTVKKRGQKVKIQQFITPHRTYESLTPLRCLYQKENNPSLWKKLMNLESHCEMRNKTEKYDSDRFVIAQFLYRFFRITAEEFSEEDILKICGIIQVNGHEIPLTDVAHVGIYETSSMLEHSCFPNCCKSFASDEKLIVRATRKIRKGEHITISYTDPLWSTINRREHLAITKFFYCECARCADPTENATYYGSLKCFDKQCNGYVIPKMVKGKNLLPEVTWICEVCSCLVPNDLVDGELYRIGQDFALTDKQSTKSCKLFIDHYTRVNFTLHPNHYFLTNMRLKLAQLYGQTQNSIHNLSDDDLQHKIVLSEQVLNLSNILFPAEWRIRGVLYFELHAAVAVQARRDFSNEQETVDQLIAELTRSKKYLDESMFHLKYEPEELPEGKMAKQAEQNLIDLNILLTDLEQQKNNPKMDQKLFES